MAGTEHVREILARASGKLLEAARAEGFDSERVKRLLAANGYARGVLDTLGAYLADEDADERVVALSTERRRGPDGRFMPSEHAQALRDGTADPS